MVVRSSHLRLLDGADPLGDSTLVESYRRLADVFHEVLAEQSLDALLVRIADTVGDLIPHDIAHDLRGRRGEADVEARARPATSTSDEIMSPTSASTGGHHRLGGSTARPCSRTRRTSTRACACPGHADEPESLICVPLVARGHVKGALNIYRDGEDVGFTEMEFELAKRFGDAAALALDNAEIRARLEHQARTDSLTGLLNHSVFYEQLLHALQESSRTTRRSRCSCSTSTTSST